MQAPDFWDDNERSKKLMKQLSALKEDCEGYAKLEQQLQDIEMLIEMGEEEEDQGFLKEIKAELELFEENFGKIQMKTLNTQPYLVLI